MAAVQGKQGDAAAQDGSDEGSDDGRPSSVVLPFGEWVAQRWHCSREADPVEYERAVQLAETSLFGQPDEAELEEEEEKQRGADGSGCIPLVSVPKLGECASLSSLSVKDDKNPRQPHKPPLLDHLEDLAAEYFGACLTDPWAVPLGVWGTDMPRLI